MRRAIDYFRMAEEAQRHRARFVRYVESKRLTCMDCRGMGGETEVILDDGSGPWCECGWCLGTGYMTPHGRGMWLRFKREEKRVALAQTERAVSLRKRERVTYKTKPVQP